MVACLGRRYLAMRDVPWADLRALFLSSRGTRRHRIRLPRMSASTLTILTHAAVTQEVPACDNNEVRLLTPSCSPPLSADAVVALMAL